MKHLLIGMVEGLIVSSLLSSGHTSKVFMVDTTFSSEMMFGSYHESYYHPYQLLLFRRQLGPFHWLGNIGLLIGSG
jgi:hypothetical protein